jgi:hypothetical protein
MSIPTGNHTDWPFPFNRIPRSWTAFESTVPPVKIAGTERVEDNLDIPERGKWVIAGVGGLHIPVFFALTTTSGFHIRIGLLRYDYVDSYYTGPTFTIKQLS